MAEDGGVEPHPISENPVFKAGRSTNTAASSSITLVLRTRIELVMDAYQASVIPFNYPSKILVLPSRIELLSMVLQTTAMTTSAKAALGCLMRIELILSRSQRDVQTTTL